MKHETAEKWLRILITIVLAEIHYVCIMGYMTTHDPVKTSTLEKGIFSAILFASTLFLYSWFLSFNRVQLTKSRQS